MLLIGNNRLCRHRNLPERVKDDKIKENSFRHKSCLLKSALVNNQIPLKNFIRLRDAFLSCFHQLSYSLLVAIFLIVLKFLFLFYNYIYLVIYLFFDW